MFQTIVLGVASNHMEHTGKAFRWLEYRWILFAIFIGLPAFSLGQPTVNVRPSPIPGIELIGPSQPEFKETIAKLLPGPNSRAALEPVLPYSVLVHNSATRTVVSYVVCFEFTRADGSKGPNRIHVRDYRTSEPKLAASISHLIAPIGALTQAIATGNFGSVTQNQGYADELGQFTIVTVYLDAVVYDDGEFVGPDIYGHLEQLGVTAEYARIAHQLTRMRGEPDDAVMVWLKQQESEALGKIGAVVGPAVMGHVTMIELEVTRIRMLEESLLKGDAGRFGSLVNVTAGDGAVPLLWRRKSGKTDSPR